MVSCVKATMIALNSIMCAVGLSVGITALVYYYEPYLLEGVAIPAYNALMMTGVIVGFLILLITCVGLAGAFTDNICLLITYIVMVVLTMVISLGLCILAFYIGVTEPGKELIVKVLRAGFNLTLSKYGEVEKIRTVIHALQNAYRCCGCNNVMDYRNPEMVGTVVNDGGQCKLEFQWTGCCREIPEYYYRKVTPVVLGIGGGFLAAILIQLLGVIFACILAGRVKHEYSSSGGGGGGRRGVILAPPRM